jgi:hypothetical protein
MMSNKLYFRLLTLFVAMLGVAQVGWVLYFLTPARQETKPSPKYLVIRGFSSPTFKYRYRELSEDGLDAAWREVEVPEETGGKILNLLRGSKSTALVLDEYYRQNPGRPLRYRLFYPNSIGVLDVYENGSDKPALNIDFQASTEFIVTRRGGDSDLFVLSSEKRREIEDLTAAIQWGPILKAE